MTNVALLVANIITLMTATADIQQGLCIIPTYPNLRIEDIKYTIISWLSVNSIICKKSECLKLQLPH